MRKIALLLFGVLLATTSLLAQNRTVTGRVIDEKGSPISGVSVTSSEGRNGTKTDADGNFTLSVTEKTKSLKISYVGYSSIVQSIGDKSSFTIVLAEAKKDLDEVIVTGYSKEKKPNFTGASARVSDKELQNVPMGSFDNMIQGRAPGVLITSGSGQPGANARVQIRGQGSISGGNGPLYIMDGIPIEAGTFATLNADDFESIDVLKDAAATAQYGSRASNGVIVITTKKGRAGVTSITFRNSYGWANRTQGKFEMMTTDERLKFEEIEGKVRPASTYPGWFYSKQNPRYATLTPAGQAFADNYLDSLRKINVNWQDVFFVSNAPFRQHELEISGGSDKTTFYINGNVYLQDGIGIRSNLNRYTLRTNVSHSNSNFSVALNSSVGYSERNFIESEGAVALANPFAAAFLSLPYQAVYNPGTTNISTGGGRVGPNAFERIFNTTSLLNELKVVSSLNLTYKIVDGLTARANVGIDYRQTDNSRYINPNSFVGSQVVPGNAGLYGEGYFRNFQYTLNSGLNYNKKFKEVHEIDVTALYEFSKTTLNSFNYTGYSINPKLPNTPAGITPGSSTNNLIPVLGGGKNFSAFESFVGLFRYTYDEKYNFTASYRRDGSSRAPVNNRYIDLWSVGANWIITKEKFMANSNLFDNLKLRASYGKVANNDGFPGNFAYLPTYGNTTYAGIGGVAPTSPGNEDLNWEYQLQSNIGIDFAMWKNRIRGSVDVYERLTKDLFVNQQLSRTSGFTAQSINAGEVSNKGIEFLIDVDVIKTKDFTWTLSANAGYNKNEVVNLGQVNEFEQGTSIIRVGLPLGSHYVVPWAGVDPQTGEPLYVDKTTKAITKTYAASNSIAEFGTFNAPFIGGFGTKIVFKGFDINALFSFQSGFSRFNNEVFFYTYGNSPNNQFNLSREMLNAWQKPGDVTDLQSPAFVRQFTSKDVQDASYIRFRNLTIGYTLPNSILGKSRYIKGFRVYSVIQNVFTWTSWRGFDPEDNNNIAQYEYPATRTITFGVDIKL
jgi:TonB-linked SusC/RagA family outer membrane protein